MTHEIDLIAARELALEYEKRSIDLGPDHKWLVLTAIGRGRALAAVESDRLREALRGLLEAYSKPEMRLCCEGRECPCLGATSHQEAEHFARAALQAGEGK